MKITDWRKGDITPNKRGSNQYIVKQKTMSKGKAWAIVLLSFFAIGAILTGYNAYSADASIFTKVFMGKDVEQIKIQSELTQEQEAKLKKQYELSIKETTLLNKKEKLESDIANIEKELEGVRAESLSLK